MNKRPREQMGARASSLEDGHREPLLGAIPSQVRRLDGAVLRAVRSGHGVTHVTTLVHGQQYRGMVDSAQGTVSWERVG